MHGPASTGRVRPGASGLANPAFRADGAACSSAWKIAIGARASGALVYWISG